MKLSDEIQNNSGKQFLTLLDQKKIDLLNDIYTINQSLKIFSEDQLVNVLLFGSENFKLDANASILGRATEFLKVNERFNSLLILFILSLVRNSSIC